MSEDTSSGLINSGRVKSRKVIYSQAAVYAPKAIEVVAQGLNSKNENIRLGAAKIILQKTLPDLKAIEVSGDDVRPLIIRLDASPTISTEATGSLEPPKK